MRRIRWLPLDLANLGSVLTELVGLGLVTLGLHQIYEPAALVFGGAALVFIAQGMGRRE